MTSPDNHEVNAGHLNDLPADIHKSILDYLDVQDYRSLRLVSKIWDAHLRVDGVVQDLRFAAKKGVFILESPRDPLGEKPFCILDVRVERETHESGDVLKKIIIDTYRPVFMKDSEGVNPLDLVISGNALSLERGGEHDWENRDNKRDDLNIDYDVVCRRNFVPATPVSV